MDYVDMRDVERAHQGHWFEPQAKRFFRSRLPQTAYRGVGGTFFVSSEQFVGSQGAAPRAYTVRYVTDDGSIETAGPFNELSRATAHRYARRLADIPQSAAWLHALRWWR
jgi:hypothetical protein